MEAGERINIRFRQPGAPNPFTSLSMFVDFYEMESGSFLQRALLALASSDRGPYSSFNIANYDRMYALFPIPDPPLGAAALITPGSYFNIGDTLHTVTQTELTNNLHDDCRDINLDFTPKLDVIPSPPPAISWDSPRVIARLTNNKVEAREDSYGRTAVSFDWEQA